MIVCSAPSIEIDILQSIQLWEFDLLIMSTCEQTMNSKPKI
jgi:hypothetical protein